MGGAAREGSAASRAHHVLRLARSQSRQEWATAIAEHCEDVRVLDLEPQRDDGFDLSDFVAEARDETEHECGASFDLGVKFIAGVRS